MINHADPTVKQAMRQMLALRRREYPGMGLRIRVGAEGWRIIATGPCGVAETLLPRGRPSYLPTLRALFEQVSKDNLGGAA